MFVCFSDISYYYELFYDPEFGLPYILERVECTSDELQLSQCNYVEYNDNYFIPFHATFAVKCQTTRQSKFSDTYSCSIIMVNRIIIVIAAVYTINYNNATAHASGTPQYSNFQYYPIYVDFLNLVSSIN